MPGQETLRNLENAVAIITGASSGLGWATAKLLASQRIRVFATARRAERLQTLVDEIRDVGGVCAYLAGDAGESGFAEQVVEQATSTFGAIDILVNNAGQGLYKSLADTSLAEFDGLVSSNLRSSFLFTKAVASGFVARQQGTLIFVSSVAGLAGAANETVYSATKFAQVGFAQAVDEELRPHGVKVCTICPGGMKTEFAIGRGRDAEQVKASAMMDPAEAAEAILFACMQPPNLRIPQLVVRHMGRKK